MDSNIRSWTKAFTWRLVGIGILWGVGYGVTGSVREASMTALLFHLIQILTYYLHERIWERVSWGRGGEPESKLPFYISLLTLIILFALLWVLGS